MISSGFFTGASGVKVFVVSFSGKPNLTARLAKTSSLIPKEAVLIGSTFGFEAEFPDGEATFVGLGDVRFDDALGSNGIPNRSARALSDCCSLVRDSLFESDGFAESYNHSGQIRPLMKGSSPRGRGLTKVNF